VPSPNTRFAAALAGCAAALLLSSCGSSPSKHASDPHSEDKPVISGEPAGSNSTDVTFANNVTALEEQGVKISLLVPDHSNDSGIVTFAAKTGAALQVDTEVLKALRAQWKGSQDDQTTAAAPGPTASGTLDVNTLARLDSLRGPEFNTLWLKSMIGLDQGAIQGSNDEVANGKNVDAVSLAKQIAKARQAEIDQMQDMLAS
jgi:uncharacterized protein (DUF305 family)